MEQRIRELEGRIRALTEENYLLAEQAEDALLLSLISESIQRHDSLEKILNEALEQISILKVIPFASCCRIQGLTLDTVAVYNSFSNDPTSGPQITLSQTILDELRYGPSLALSGKDLDFNFDNSDFTPDSCLLIPFRSQQINDGLFLFADSNRAKDEYSPLLVLLNQVADMVMARCDNVYLFKELTRINHELEDRVEQRTHDLIKANEALRKSELKYRQLIENTLDLVYVVQADKIVFANENTANFFDCTMEELYRTPYLDFISTEDRETVANNYMKRIAGHEDAPSNYSFTVRPRGGETRTVQISAVLVDWNDHQATLNYARDITDQVKFEQAIQQARKMEAVGQLANGVAHDFNNMLGGIIGAAELLGYYLPDDPKAKKFHKMILDVAERAGDLTDNLLTFSRVNPRASSVVDLHDIIKETVVLMKKTIDPRIDIVDNLHAPKSSINGNVSQLQNIFLNLGINASQAMPAGGTITISSKYTELDALYCDFSTFDITPGHYLKVEIRDTGFGIAPVHLSRIFEPFFTTKELGKGTGLGLASVYGSMRQHNGAITVYSEVSQGTSFHLLFPLIDSEIQALLSDPIQVGGNERILIVDDEEVMRITARAMLEDIGYEVVLATNGREGFEMYSKDPLNFDLVILDMVMPIMNGKDCFEAIMQFDPKARVILSSGFSREQDIKMMKSMGLKGFVQKPYRAIALSQAIIDALR